MFNKTTIAAAMAIATSVLLVACGGNDSNDGAVILPTTGILQGTPAPTAALSAAQFTGALSSSSTGMQLLQAAGTPLCGVSVSHIEFSTAGAAGEPTTSSGAVMVPTGTDPACSGKRPIVLYAHGTTTSKAFNMAAGLTTPTNAAAGEATLVAATFAAQGYVVIAPNYAGYDTSTLPYHPYVNYKQQSQEMIDALRAGRAALPTGLDSGKLFVTGYSEGGYVAMAALKAMDAMRMTVTAAAPMSGPYSLAAYGDAVFYGNTPIGGTVFAPLLTAGYQKAYGNIYNLPSDAYTATFATGIDTLLPTLLSQAQIFSTGKLPLTAMFQSAPTGAGAGLDALSPASPSFSFGFAASNYLISTAYRAAYLADAAAHPDGAVPTVTASPLPTKAATNGLRKAFALNDLRGYIPSMPMLMCGGHSDPTVFFKPNTQLMAGILGSFASAGVPVSFAMLDVDGTGGADALGFSSAGLSPTVTTTMTAASTQLISGFGAARTATILATQSNPTVIAAANAAAAAAAAAVLANGGTPAAATAAGQQAATAYVTAEVTSAVAQSYHGALVPPVCTIAARTFFQQY
jgi:Prolyl oligopeptidase family